MFVGSCRRAIVPDVARDKARRSKLEDRHPGPPWGPAPWTFLLPAAVLAVLCLPCLRLGYFWDDYYFLTLRGLGDYRSYLVPDPHAAFYRPISQGLYFLLLLLVDPAQGTVGHVLNLAVLAITATLLVLLVSRLCGPRAGLVSGLVLACYGLVPGLVAWISCIQDLLAVGLVLAALLLRHQGRDIGALACATAAVLCKEPAIAAFPVLVLWDPLVGRPPSRPRFQALAYTSVALVWALIHPGIRVLAAHGFRSGATGYVGIEHPDHWGSYFLRYLMTLANLPPLGLTTSWWDDRVQCGLVALVLLVAGFLLLDRRVPRDRPSGPMPPARVAVIAALLGVPTLLMPTLLIRHWAPYFAFMPAVGLAVYLGPLLARRPTLVILAVLAVFLLLGVRYRGLQTDQEPIWSERTFDAAAKAVSTVRANFRTIFPSFPKGSQVVVSVSSTGVRGIYSTLVEGQALRVWYQDPTLHTVPTLKRAPGARAEYLVRVTTDLNVISIDPDSRRIRSTAGYRPDISEIGRPIANYARAVAAAGDTDRAVRMTLSLAEGESGANVEYVRRLAAMFLLAADRREEAGRILATTSPLSMEDALWSIKPLLTEPSASERVDDAAFEAFGLSSRDPEAIRWFMRHFQREGALAQAAWYAERLHRLVPEDMESISTIEAAARTGIRPRRTPD